MGNTAAQRDEILRSQLKKTEKSRMEFEDGYYDEILNRSRIQLEFLLTYILKCENLYDFPAYPPVTLYMLISKCKKRAVLPDEILENLSGIKNYCNIGSHYSEAIIGAHSILFVINVTDELLKFWQSKYIKNISKNP